MTALCVACGCGEPGPMICGVCEQRARRDLGAVLRMRRDISAWTEIDPGTPGTDQRHRLALVDNPVMTASGGPDLTVIAATDVRTRRIIRGWHDAECMSVACRQRREPGDEPCHDPAHRADTADDVVNVDAELLGEARLICEGRMLSRMPGSVAQCLEVIEAGFDWSVRSERADEFVAVLASCAHALRNALKDTPERPLGSCPQNDPRGEFDRCGGPLRWRSVDVPAWSSVAAGDDLAAIELECGRCGDVWTARDLVLFGRVTPINIWESVPRVAEMLDMSERTLRHWVAVGKVRRDSLGRVLHADVWRRIIKSKSAPSQQELTEG